MQYLLHILAVLPGLFICYLIFKLDKYEREPLGALIFCFVLGMVATIPVILLQRYSGMIYQGEHHGVLLTLFSSFGIVATTEEGIKCVAVLLGPFPRKYFNEPIDGIVYAVLVAMGFATVENLIYAVNFGMNTTIVRAFTAVPAHFVFAIVQGYYLGLAKFNPKRRLELILQGLGIAVFMHGLYDFLILQDLSEWLSVLGSASIYVCLYYCGPLIRAHLDNSPFRRKRKPH